MTLAAVFLVSFSTLAFEVLLARVFAVSQWNHLSFLVISVALFGFAASGTVLAALKSTRSDGSDPFPQRWVPFAALLFAASLLAVLVCLNRVPLDYHRLPHQPAQALYLLVVYLAVAVPFFFSGALVAGAFIRLPAHPGTVYWASMSGSALGALAPALLLPFLDEARLLIAAALLPLALFAFGAGPGRGAAAAALLVAAAAIFLLTPGAAPLREIAPSEFKFLSQVLQFPETRVVEARTSVRGRIERVASPHLRFAPGLSLQYPGALPAAQAVFSDGDRPLFLYDTAASGWPDFARHSLSFTAYAVAPRLERVLVIAGGGGLAIACAAASGAAEVLILHPNPAVAQMIGRHYRMNAAPEQARTRLARAEERFDVIHLENWGATIPGAGALDQDHTLTVEAFSAYLQRLTPEGLFVVSRRLLLPPADSLRLWSAARQALAAAGVAEPERCLALLRSWDSFTLLMARSPLRATAPLLERARSLNFDVVFLAEAGAELANRYSVFDAPYHYQEHLRLAQAYSAGRAQEYFRDYLIDAAPQSDLRPFPERFLKWSRAGELHRTLGGRSHVFLFSGEAVVAVVFAEALLVSLALLLIPRRLGPEGTPRLRPAVLFFFLSIGAGFMSAELFLVYAGTFFLGDPVLSLTLVAAGVLVAAGAGGLAAQRLGASALRGSAVAAVFCVALAALGLGAAAETLLALPWTGRCGLVLAAAMTPGFAMGMLFPLGMRFAAPRPADKAYAWAANGCAAVLAAIASAQLAIGIGIHAIAAAALLCYVAAALAGGYAHRG
ncbi:MAG: hypothetical protein MUD16_10185 [Desulfobacterales bacterium]|nr:hypothetical protein [Desulfobacterales bacterium]